MNSRKKTFLHFLLLMVSLCPMGWAQMTFYEAYDEGMAKLEEGLWLQAEQHFIRAVELKPKAGRNIKKYGLNFISKYDPYFHLAKVNIELHRPEKAKAFLDRALKARVMPKKELKQLQLALSSMEVLVKNDPKTPAGNVLNKPDEVQDKITEKVQESIAEAEKEPSFSKTEEVMVSIKSEPLGASVFLDGQITGRTPLDLVVPWGRCNITVSLKGYQTIQRSLVIKSNQSSIEIFKLVPLEIKPLGDLAKNNEGSQKPSVKKGSEQPLVKHDALANDKLSTQPSQLPEDEDKDQNLSTEKARPDTGVEEQVSNTNEINSLKEKEFEPISGKVDRATSKPDVTFFYLGVILLMGGIFTGFFWLRKRKMSQKPPTDDSQLEGTIAINSVEPGPSTLEMAGYQLVSLIGRGGMGLTYRATKKGDTMEFAIKTLHAHLHHDEDVQRRFVREGQLGTTLHHPGIVRIFEAGRHEDIPFIAMELLHGKTLAQELSPSKKLPLNVALQYARCVATALDYAHLKGVIHRDLKPENLMLLPDGKIKVLDFGIAKLQDIQQTTSTQSFIGTPAYAAPELLTPDHIKPESDLYSLGIILYRMLSGKVPFIDNNPLAVLQCHMETPIPTIDESIDIPESVWALITKLTAKKIVNRYRSAEDVINDIDKITKQITLPPHQ